MKRIRPFVLPFVLIIILLLVIFNLDSISTFVSDLLNGRHNVVIMPSNSYTKNNTNLKNKVDIKDGNQNTKKNGYLFVGPSSNYEAYSYQNLLDIYYSIINNGWTNFTFYCPREYKDCISDVSKISDDSELLTHLNNFTHPYNNFSSLKTIIDESGEINISIEHLYTDEMINEINAKVDSIISSVITDDMDDETKILVIHDYIINNAKYDIVKNETGESEYKSNTAYGSLIEGYAICGGYADAMAIFLTRLGFDNYKIASLTHVWNGVYVNDKWLHLDLTWDDPVSEKGVDYLYHKYFLVNDEELKNADGDLNNHEYDLSIYLEFKKKA